MTRPRTRGPLRPSRRDPRLLEDAAGRTVPLLGIHTWACLATDQGASEFDHAAFLDRCAALGHTFVRGWTWDVPWSHQGFNGGPFRFAPQPFARTGPGLATDGLPRFDLARWDDAYFHRIRTRVTAAADRGLYGSVMLFQGFAWQFDRTDTDGMPYDGRNNVNDVDAGPGDAAATLTHPAVVEAQERYVRHMVEAVGDLDNLLYEVSNESGPDSSAWQRRMIRVLRDAQRAHGRNRPIGMTHQFDGGRRPDLEGSGADWISPNSDPATRALPDVARGGPVVVYDTDHGYDWRALQDDGPQEWRRWIWRCLMAGAGGVLFMDPYLARIRIGDRDRNTPLGSDPRDPRFGIVPDPRWDPLREALGHAARFASEVDLAGLAPVRVAGAGTMLSQPGRRYALAVDAGRAVRLRVPRGTYAVRAFDPRHGRWTARGTHADTTTLTLAAGAADAVLLAERRAGVRTPRRAPAR